MKTSENGPVLVTGAAGALGHAVATAFKSQGKTLALFDLDLSKLRDLFGADSDQVTCHAVDLTDAKAIMSAVSDVMSRHGRIDALCNVAGGFQMGPAVHETPHDLWQRMMDLNAHTVLHMTAAVVPHMLAAGAGKIVNVGAASANKGCANMAAYIASKSVVIRLTESLSAEVRDAGLNVNCVLPSILDTPANRTDMPDAAFDRWVSTSDLAAVISFLCSDAARAIHGAAIPVTGRV